MPYDTQEPLSSLSTLSSQQTQLDHLPVHTDVISLPSQQAVSDSRDAIGFTRQLLEEAPDHTADHAAIKTDLTSASPNVTLQETSGSRKADEAPVEDASHQQAMQHGAGATDPGRELQRQLGQRFDRSSADQEEAKAAAAGQISPQAPELQAEITPGTDFWTNPQICRCIAEVLISILITVPLSNRHLSSAFLLPVRISSGSSSATCCCYP